MKERNPYRTSTLQDTRSRERRHTVESRFAANQSPWRSESFPGPSSAEEGESRPLSLRNSNSNLRAIASAIARSPTTLCREANLDLKTGLDFAEDRLCEAESKDNSRHPWRVLYRMRPGDLISPPHNHPCGRVEPLAGSLINVLVCLCEDRPGNH